MGLMIDGVWYDRGYETEKHRGRFVRLASTFRNWVTADGAPGPSGEGGFRAEPGRYHLYVSYACPWASRTLIFRRLKGLDMMIGLSVTHWLMGSDGWTFEAGDGVIPDGVNGVQFMRDLYRLAKPDFTGRVTVPVLWDKERRTIVSNESSEIIRMFNSAFDGVGALPGDYYPEPLRADIDALNARIYETVNNGVYRAGFATTQEAYEEALYPLFGTLDWLEGRLRTRRFLFGDEPTEADWRLFTTLIRFDAVYFSHFKCNIRRIADYPNLWAYARDLYQWPGVTATVNFAHIKRHYYGSHRMINPTGIVPIGPEIDYARPHERERLIGGGLDVLGE